MTRDPALCADFAFRGLWWLPERPSERVPGTLHVKGGHDIKLELLGTLDEARPTRGELVKFPIILGTSERGEVCTLFRAARTGHSAPLNAVDPHGRIPVTSEVLAGRLYLGKHYSDAGGARFRSVRIRLTNLEEWLGWNPFIISHAPKRGGTTVRIPCTYRRHFEFRDPIGEITVSAWSAATETLGLSSFGTEFNAHIEIAAREPDDFEWYSERIFDMQHLLTLFTGSPVYAESIVGLDDDIEYAPSTSCPEEIGIYFTIKRWPQRGPNRRCDMPVTFQAVESYLSSVLAAWFSCAQKLRLVFELFFGAEYNDDMYADSKFINLTQALEVFHRVTFGGHPDPPDGYHTWCRNVFASVPEGFPKRLRQRLQDRINQANSYSLQDRLADLISRLDASTRDKILDGSHGLPRNVTRARNFLTHGGESRRGKSFSGPSEYFRANEKLRAILVLHIFKMLGIPERQVAPAVLRRLTVLRGW